MCETFGHFGEECIREVCQCTLSSFNIITDIVLLRNKMILLLTSSWACKLSLALRENKARIESLISQELFAIGNGMIWEEYTGNAQLF